MADRDDQDSPATFVEDFNLLAQAASLSAEGSLAQEFSGALNRVAANSLKVAKLLTLLVVPMEGERTQSGCGVAHG
jgi:hypothetical protein